MIFPKYLDILTNNSTQSRSWELSTYVEIFWGVRKCKYGKMKYDWAGVENASTNSAGTVKHNNSPIIKKWQTAVTVLFKLVKF